MKRTVAFQVPDVRSNQHHTIVLWIDALGVEWMPLLQWSVRRICDATVKKCAIAQATLPTETCFNDQWKNINAPYKKLDKLDKLAHKGVVDAAKTVIRMMLVSMANAAVLMQKEKDKLIRDYASSLNISLEDSATIITNVSTSAHT